MTRPLLKRRRAGLALVTAVALLVTGCSVETALPVPDCFQGGSSLIVAQSVPTADFVPCFLSMPPGWERDTVKIDENGTRVRLDSDRAGSNAAVLHYVPTCDFSAAVAVPSDQDGADRYDNVERVEPGFRAKRYYVFTGGCIWWEFDFDDGASASLSIELGDALALWTRDAVNQNIRESFIDEEL